MSSKAEKLAKKIFKSEKFKIKDKNRKGFEQRYKIVVFVPAKNADDLTFAMASAGAGIIGNYTLCSFRIPGKGTFKGNEQSEPAAGEKGKFESADEIRLEMICDKENLDKITEKIFETHPYDEPAFEIYRILTKKKMQSIDIAEVLFDKKIQVKKILKSLIPEMNLKKIPENLKDIKIKTSIVDCTGKENLDLENLPGKILYIKKYKNNIKAYLT